MAPPSKSSKATNSNSASSSKNPFKTKQASVFVKTSTAKSSSQKFTTEKGEGLTEEERKTLQALLKKSTVNIKDLERERQESK